LRIYTDLKNLENFFLNISEGKFPKTYRDVMEFDNKFLQELEKNFINFIDSLNLFFSKKIENLNCSHCLQPGKLKCSKCNLKNYCCEKHMEIHKRNEHFFECNIIQFIKSINETYSLNVLKNYLKNDDFSDRMKEERIIILCNNKINNFSKIYS